MASASLTPCKIVVKTSREYDVIIKKAIFDYKHNDRFFIFLNINRCQNTHEISGLG